MADRE